MDVLPLFTNFKSGSVVYYSFLFLWQVRQGTCGCGMAFIPLGWDSTLPLRKQEKKTSVRKLQVIFHFRRLFFYFILTPRGYADTIFGPKVKGRRNLSHICDYRKTKQGPS